MGPKYKIGQKVIIKPVGDKRVSPRDSAIDSYAGQVGEVANYYWVSPRTGQVFYIYSIRIGTGYKAVVFYEDEIETYIT